MGRIRQKISSWGPFAGVVFSCLLVGVLAWVVLRSDTKGEGAGGASRALDGVGLTTVIEAAETLRLQGEREKSEAVLREAVSKYSTKQDAHVALAELLIDKASGLSDAQSATPILEEAFGCYERALTIGPRSADLEFVAGTLAAKLDRWERAERHYAAANEAAPGEARYPLYLAQVQLRGGRLVEAKRNLTVAAELDPESAAAWGTLAEIALREEDAESALRNVSRARDLEPSKPVWRVIEARALVRINRYREALDLLVGLDDEAKYDSGVLAVLATCYEKIERLGEAAALYVKAADARPADGAIALGAARTLIQVGQRGEARRHAERAAMLGTPGARELLSELDAK